MEGPDIEDIEKMGIIPRVISEVERFIQLQASNVEFKLFV